MADEYPASRRALTHGDIVAALGYDPAETGGSDGKDAYELAVEAGFDGTPSEWLASLQGAGGADAYAIAVANGFVGSQEDWVASLQGRDGTTPEISIGQVVTLPPGSQASVVKSGSASNIVLDIALPQGATGNPGGDLTDEARSLLNQASAAATSLTANAASIDQLFDYQRIGVPSMPADGTAANHTNFHFHNAVITQAGQFKGFGYFAKSLAPVTVGLLSFAHEPPQLNDACIVHDSAIYTPTQLGPQIVTAGQMSKIMTGVPGYHWGINGNGAFTTSVDTDGSDPGYYLVGAGGVGNLTNGSKLEVYFETRAAAQVVTASAVKAALDTAAVVAATNSNNVNRGKDLPLRRGTRNAVTSPASAVLNKFLLRCRIYGRSPGKDYQLAFVNNGSIPNSTCVGALTDGNAYPVGSTVINLTAAGTGAVVAGSRIQFAGDTNTYIPSVGEVAVDDGGTITLPLPGLRLPMAAGQHAVNPVIAYPYGVTINEFDRGTMATADNALPIHTYTNSAPNFDTSLTEQTVVITPALRSGMRFELTVDPSQLPPVGTALSANSATRDAYSWPFDESCYDQAMATAVWTGQEMWFQIDAASQMLTTVFRAGPKMIRRRFWPRGPNLLPDRRDRSVADFGDPTAADWTPRLITYSGDTAQPIAMLAVGDGEHPVDPTVTDMEYTGGNHGLGINDAEPTAHNAFLQYVIDGSPASGDMTGVANLIEIRSVNELMAGNTFSLSRTVLSQSFTYYVRPGSIEIMADNEPLEDLLVGTDNGAQSFTQGFQAADGGQQIWIGKDNGFVDFNAALNSGEKRDFPGVCGVLFKSALYGVTGMWMDPTYGDPYGAFVTDDSPMCRGAGGNPNTKFYLAKVAGAAFPFPKGQHYRYRAVIFDIWPGAGTADYITTIPISRNGLPDTLLLKSNGLIK